MAIFNMPQGETASEAIGKNLGVGIQNILNMKMQQMLQQKQQAENARGISALLGVAPEQAQLIAQTNPDILKAVIPQMLKAQAAAPQQQAYAQALQSILGGGRAEIPEGLTEHQATELAKIQLQKEETQAKTQERKELERERQAIRESVPFEKDIETARTITGRLVPEIQRMRNALESGKVSTRLLGKITPGFLLNPESAEFEAAGADIVNLLSGELRGPASRFKLESLAKTKPLLSQPRETQEKRLQYWEQQIGDMAKKIEIRDKLVAENDNKIPRNLSSKVENELNKWKKAGRPGFIFGETPEGYKEEEIIEDEEGNYFVIQEGKPVPIDKSRVTFGE